MTRRITILDACQAITFGSIERFDLVTDLQRHDVAIGARASREVLREPAASLIRSAIADGALRVEAIDLSDPGESAAFARYESMPAFRGRGDAEILAIAECRGCLVGSDDEAVLRAVGRAHGIPGFVSSLDLMVWAIRENRISVEEAERLIDRLDIGSRIRERLSRMRRSLPELV